MSDNTALKDKKPRKPYLTLLFTVYALCYGVLLVFLTVQLAVASGGVAAFFASMLYFGIFGLVVGSLTSVAAIIAGLLYMLGYMLVWGILTGMAMTQLRLRRNLKHILTAMLIGFVCSYISTILFALFLSKDIEMLFNFYFEGLTIFSLLNAFAVIPFGLVFLPSESGYKREREIAVKTVKAGIHAGQVIFEHATEKKGVFSYRWWIPLAFALAGTPIFLTCAFLMQPDSAFPDTQAWSAHFIPMTFFGFAAMVASGLTAMLMRLRKDQKGILSGLALSSAYFGVMVYLPPIKNPDLNPYAHLLNPYWLLAAWLISVGVCIWLSFKKVDSGNRS
ncbi:MAG: hypothetical protein HXM81_01155 [Neisseria sicca]|jgi:hypothetical protein|nr:hypothetical protein [Neisseria sicca]